MPAAVYLDLAVSACATTFSPGPNNILLLSSTSTHGFRKCMPLIFGIWTGLLTVMLICGFGCAFLGELVPQIVPVAKYVGAAYILYLAWKTLIRKTGDAAAESKPLTYVNGFLLQFDVHFRGSRMIFHMSCHVIHEIRRYNYQHETYQRRPYEPCADCNSHRCGDPKSRSGRKASDLPPVRNDNRTRTEESDSAQKLCRDSADVRRVCGYFR